MLGDGLILFKLEKLVPSNPPVYHSTGNVLYHYSDRGNCNEKTGLKISPPIFRLHTNKQDYETALNKQLVYLMNRMINEAQKNYLNHSEIVGRHIICHETALSEFPNGIVCNSLPEDVIFTFDETPGIIYHSDYITTNTLSIDGEKSKSSKNIDIAMLLDLGKLNIIWRNTQMTNNFCDLKENLDKVFKECTSEITDYQAENDEVGDICEEVEVLSDDLGYETLTEEQKTYYEQKNTIVSQALDSPEGRVALAQAMVEPATIALTTSSCLRKILFYSSRDDYDINGNCSLDPKKYNDVYSIWNTDTHDLIQLYPTHTQNINDYNIPMCELASWPTISLRQIKGRKFELVDQAQIRGVSALIRQELSLVVRLLNELYDKSKIREVKFPLGERYVNPSMIDAIRKENRANGSNGKYSILCPEVLADWIAQYTQENVYFYNSTKFYNGEVTGYDNKVFVLPEPEKAGRVVDNRGITVLPADDPRRLKLGWVMYEHIGIALMNTDLIWCIDLS